MVKSRLPHSNNGDISKIFRVLLKIIAARGTNMPLAAIVPLGLGG